MGRKMASAVSNGASAPFFDRLVNRIIDSNIGIFFFPHGLISLSCVQYY